MFVDQQACLLHLRLAGTAVHLCLEAPFVFCSPTFEPTRCVRQHVVEIVSQVNLLSQRVLRVHREVLFDFFHRVPLFPLLHVPSVVAWVVISHDDCFEIVQQEITFLVLFQVRPQRRLRDVSSFEVRQVKSYQIVEPDPLPHGALACLCQLCEVHPIA